jgi:REP element-mobilizing transposase RayT
MKQRKYIYRRNLPHIEKEGRPHFITFDTYLREILPPHARDLVLNHCLHDNGTKMQLHIAVVMPDHVHLIFTPLRSDSGELFTFEEIVGAIKGASAHSVNKALERKGHLWQDESFDHVIRCEEKLEEKIQYVWENPVRAGLVGRSEDYKWLWRESKPAQPGAAVPHDPPVQIQARKVRSAAK